jgi:quercetin dioxygenase-like cupin family protein
MFMPSRYTFVAAVAALAVCPALLAPSAAATPAIGVTSTNLSGQKTADRTDYLVREITIQPGGSTGWHIHRGVVYGIVKAGTLTRNAADCSVSGVDSSGDPITDPSGDEHVHIGRNLGTIPVVLEITYVDPDGVAPSDSASNPGCDFN